MRKPAGRARNSADTFPGAAVFGRAVPFSADPSGPTITNRMA